MRRFLHENGLSTALFALFAFSLVGQYLTGWNEYNDDQKLHNQPLVTLTGYLGTGHFIEALFENWESEFLQMGAYVVLTVFLFQKGSSESKKPDAVERVDVIPESAKRNKDAPWAVRRGGFALKIYRNSLSLAFFLLFFISFILHGIGGAKDYNDEQREHNAPPVSTLGYMQTSRFWFESFQNWQSEFFSIAMMVVLSIYLRQQGSPESKPVDAAHDETGTD